jgi:hypothetical protein
LNAQRKLARIVELAFSVPALELEEAPRLILDATYEAQSETFSLG